MFYKIKQILIFFFMLCAFQTSYAISNSYITTYSNFTLPSNMMYNIDIPLKINVDPGPKSYRFFSQQLSIGTFGVYIGLQTDMMYPNNKSGKGAIFSIWNATDAKSGTTGSWCQTFGNEGSGYSCRMPYQWAAGNTYRLRIWQITNNAWSAYVMNMTTGQEVQLGTIIIPTTKNPLLFGNITTFTEYFGGDFNACSDLKPSQVSWGMPTGNNGSLTSTWLSNSIGPGACAAVRKSTGTGPTVHTIG